MKDRKIRGEKAIRIILDEIQVPSALIEEAVKYSKLKIKEKEAELR